AWFAWADSSLLSTLVAGERAGQVPGPALAAPQLATGGERQGSRPEQDDVVHGDTVRAADRVPDRCGDLARPHPRPPAPRRETVRVGVREYPGAAVGLGEYPRPVGVAARRGDLA